jgi:hypothetical protein
MTKTAGSGYISQRHGSGSGSTPKCHGSGTLVSTKRDSATIHMANKIIITGVHHDFVSSLYRVQLDPGLDRTANENVLFALTGELKSASRASKSLGT